MPADSRASPPQEFDKHAATYASDLERGLSVTGESSEYYARVRIEWVSRVLRELGLPAKSILDFGCGTGGSIGFFQSILQPARIVGIDVSRDSLAIARQRYPSPRAAFLPISEFSPRGDFDLAFCNGVFHHIAPADRAAAIHIVWEALEPGGAFAFWENNPWNPGTRYVMSRVSFDRDAITISPPDARRLLGAGGFHIARVDHRFFFPRLLRALRPLEAGLRSVPLGGQYLVMARKPAGR